MVNEQSAWRVHPDGAVFSEWTAPDGMKLRRMEWLARVEARLSIRWQ